MSDPIENVLSDDEAFPPLPPPQSPNRWDQGDGEPFADGKKKKQKKTHLLLELYAGTLHTNYLIGPNRLKLMGDSCRRRRRWRFQAGRGPCCQEENGEEATTQTRFFKVRQMAPFNTRKDFVGITCGWRRFWCSPQTDLRQRTSSSAHSVW